MFQPSPAAITAVIAFVQARPNGFADDDATILAALNAPSISNPIPQPTVRKDWNLSQLFGMVSAASLGNISKLPYLEAVRSDLDNHDYDRVIGWAQLITAGGTITPTELGTIETNLTATEPDPSWAAQVSWAQVNLGRDARAEDVQAARLPQGG